MTDLFPLERIADQIATDSWTPINLNTLPAKPPIEPTLGGTGLLYPGKRHVFSGPPDSAKTIAAYCALIAVIRTGARAALIDFEMGAYDARQRLEELGATTKELDDILYVEPADRATTERIDALVNHNPALVVVDAAAGAYDMEGLDDNHRKDVEALTRLYVKSFWRNGIATLFIDHVVKNAETRGRFMIGSERKLGGVDVHYGFDTIQPVSRGSSGRYKLIIHRDRGGYLKRGHLADLKLESDPDTHQIDWTFTEATDDTSEAGYFRPTHLMEKVSVYLELQSEASTRNQIAAALGGTKDYVLKAISALITEGFAAEDEGPNRSKLVRSLRRYREDDPSCNKTPGGSVVLCGSAGGSEPPNPCSSAGSDDPDTTSGSAVGSTKPNPGGSEWFDSGSRTTDASGGSVVRPPYGDDTTRPPAPDHPEHHGWFDTNGHLAEGDYDHYLASIEPDPDELDQ